MANWDVFRSDKLEVERLLSTERVRAALKRGDLTEEDLARPAGSSAPWTRIGDLPALAQAAAPAQAPGAGPEDDAEGLPSGLEFPPPSEEMRVPSSGRTPRGEAPPAAPAPRGPAKATPPPGAPKYPPLADADLGPLDLNLETEHRVSLGSDGHERPPDEPPDDDEPYYDPQEEDEEAAAFTLSRSGPGHVEELDLAAMVDVAFQMVLFFMVTASTILYKTLEIPKTKPESPPDAVAQAQQPKQIDDLKNDYILVEIDPEGRIKIDHEPASPDTLIDRLRVARHDSGRKAMLLSADFATPHRNAVLAYDAANEIGLSIAIAKPTAGGMAPPPPQGE